MVIILVHWLIILLVTQSWGCGAVWALQRTLGVQNRTVSFAEAFFWGLMGLTAFTSVLHFFLPVGPWMLPVFGGLGLGWAYFEKERWRQYALDLKVHWKSVHYLTALFFILLLGIALASAAGRSQIQDEAAYHLPLIRWIEYFPMAPGLANIEDRMGFNPAKYTADALFGMPWLRAGGVYRLNALIFLIVGASFLFGFGRLLKQDFRFLISDTIQVAGLVFLWRIYMAAVDADFLNIFGGLFWLCWAVRRLEAGRFFERDSGMLFFWAFFAYLATNKPSILLLAWLPLAQLWPGRGKSGWGIPVRAMGLAGIVVLPWLVHNVFLSGYLAYPLYFTGWFNVDWQVPPEIAKGQYTYVSEYARTAILRDLSDYPLAETPFRLWIGAWFDDTWAQLAGKAAILGFPLAVALLAWFFISKAWLERPEYRTLAWLAVGLSASVLAWFWRIPSLRFAWPWLLTLAVMMPLIVFRAWIGRHAKKYSILATCILAAGLFRGILLSAGSMPPLRSCWLQPPMVYYPDTYQLLELGPVDVKIAPDNYCGGLEPPCLPRHYHPGLEPRGEKASDGFRITEK